MSSAATLARQPSSESSTPYGLDRCQIDTPDRIVQGFWKLVGRHRKDLGRVIDLGAGDGRFAIGAHYKEYRGYEIDRQRIGRSDLPVNASVVHKCAFETDATDFDVCVGNPPYVRHHDIEGPWREQLVLRIEQTLGFSSNRLCNLFVYFICLALSTTKADGLVALLIPYEWVSRPSTKPLRDLIISKKWDVHVYRFREEVFKGVLTTASISIIDKAGASGRWRFYDIDTEFNVEPRRQMSGSRHAVIKYERRAAVWALRGLSPGSQKVFTLTEGERIHLGLKKSDVDPCVTSLRNLPKSVQHLTEAAFKKYFVKPGRKSWLIRSSAKLTVRLKKYLDTVPKKDRSNYTCSNRKPWYKFRAHPAPKILYSSGFIEFGPKFVVNEVSAIAVGSVHGIHSSTRFNVKTLRENLLGINFEKRVVAHAGSLKKVEVGQMNSILNQLLPSRDNL